MGFTIYYRSTEPIESDRANAIRSAARDFNKGRTWLSCEPMSFFADDGGHLLGGSKPNFQPHPDDVASAASEGLPDGTVHDLLDALCQLSQEHNVDWEFSHDADPGPIGFIHNGVADDGLIGQLNALAGLCDALAEIMHEFDRDPDGFGLMDDSFEEPDDRNDDDDPPPTIKLWSE